MGSVCFVYVEKHCFALCLGSRCISWFNSIDITGQNLFYYVTMYIRIMNCCNAAGH